MTLPLIYLFDRLPESESTRIKTLLRNPTPSVQRLIRERLEETGSLEDARQCAVRFVFQAQQALEVLPQNEYRQALQQVAEWSLKRNA